MNAACSCYQSWLDADEESAPDLAEQAAREAHIHECPMCGEQMRGVAEQRAAVRALFQARGDRLPLSEALVARYVNAMRRAANGPPAPDGPGSGT